MSMEVDQDAEMPSSSSGRAEKKRYEYKKSLKNGVIMLLVPSFV